MGDKPYGDIEVELDAQGRLKSLRVVWDAGDNITHDKALPAHSRVDTPQENILRSKTLHLEVEAWDEYEGRPIPVAMTITRGDDTVALIEEYTSPDQTIVYHARREVPTRLPADAKLAYTNVPDGKEVTTFEDAEAKLIWYQGRVIEDDGSYAAGEIDKLVVDEPLRLAVYDETPWWRGGMLVAILAGVVVVCGVVGIIAYRRKG